MSLSSFDYKIANILLIIFHLKFYLLPYKYALSRGQDNFFYNILDMIFSI